MCVCAYVSILLLEREILCNMKNAKMIDPHISMEMWIFQFINELSFLMEIREIVYIYIYTSSCIGNSRTDSLTN